MGVVVEVLVYIIVDILLLGIAAILLPLLSFGRVRLAPVDAPGTFPLHGVRRAGDGRIEVGRSQATLYVLLLLFLLLAAYLTFATR